MATKTETTSGGIGFCGVLTIVFITLKLLGKITWGWGWVLSPLWMPLAIVLTIIMVLLCCAGVAALLDQLRITRR